MIIPTFQCDECGERHERVANLTLKGQVGLSEKELHFCSWQCLSDWLEGTVERLEELRKFCNPEREPKGK